MNEIDRFAHAQSVVQAEARGALLRQLRNSGVAIFLDEATYLLTSRQAHDLGVQLVSLAATMHADMSLGEFLQARGFSDADISHMLVDVAVYRGDQAGNSAGDPANLN